jgi:hypothetical protein
VPKNTAAGTNRGSKHPHKQINTQKPKAYTATTENILEKRKKHSADPNSRRIKKLT